MSTLAAFARPAAVALGAAALFAAPAAASAAPFMPDPLANCKPAATLEVEQEEGDVVSWEFEGPNGATTDAQVTYLNIAQAPTIGTSGPLKPRPGEPGLAASKELPGFTIHVVPGGSYDADGAGTASQPCTLGFGFAVTQ